MVQQALGWLGDTEALTIVNLTNQTTNISTIGCDRYGMHFLSPKLHNATNISAGVSIC